MTTATAIVHAPAPPLFAIVDHGAVPTPNLPAIAHALERQINEHAGAFRPNGWGFAARVIAVPYGAPCPDGAIELGLFDHPDQPGALGYHDRDPRGLPYARVFPLLDAADGVSVSETLSHELIELLGDPDGNTCAQSPTDGRIWAMELCDACESETYRIDGILVSDFVLPHYFAPPGDASRARYDWLGKVTAPFQILPGGYGQYLTAHGWKQVLPPKPRRASFRVGHRQRGYARLRHHTPAL